MNLSKTACLNEASFWRVEEDEGGKGEESAAWFKNPIVQTRKTQSTIAFQKRMIVTSFPLGGKKRRYKLIYNIVKIEKIQRYLFVWDSQIYMKTIKSIIEKPPLDS